MTHATTTSDTAAPTPANSPSIDPKMSCENITCGVRIAGNAHVRTIKNRTVQLCKTCSVCYDLDKYCPFCIQIYNKGDPSSYDGQKWNNCHRCARWVHAICEANAANTNNTSTGTTTSSSSHSPKESRAMNPMDAANAMTTATTTVPDQPSSSPASSPASSSSSYSSVCVQNVRTKGETTEKKYHCPSCRHTGGGNTENADIFSNQTLLCLASNMKPPQTQEENRRCGNRLCRNENGPMTKRFYQGQDAWICKECAQCFDLQHNCPHCDQIYKNDDCRDSFDGKSWISCGKCTKSVHVSCEVINGFPLASKLYHTQGAELSSYRCPSCRGDRLPNKTPPPSMLQAAIQSPAVACTLPGLAASIFNKAFSKTSSISLNLALASKLSSPHITRQQQQQAENEHKTPLQQQHQHHHQLHHHQHHHLGKQQHVKQPELHLLTPNPTFARQHMSPLPQLQLPPQRQLQLLPQSDRKSIMIDHSVAREIATRMTIAQSPDIKMEVLHNWSLREGESKSHGTPNISSSNNNKLRPQEIVPDCNREDDQEGEETDDNDNDDDDDNDELDADPAESYDFSSLILRAAEEAERKEIEGAQKKRKQHEPVDLSIKKRKAIDGSSTPNISPAQINDANGQQQQQQQQQLQLQKKKQSLKIPKIKIPKRKRNLTNASLPNMRTTTGPLSSTPSHWVQCDNPKCLKWRRIPSNVPLEALRGKWTCKMNRWDPDRSTCEAPEEECPHESVINIKEASEDYQQEKEQFYNHLKEFLELVGTPMSRNPTLGGKDLDLYRLYREVTARGGCDQVVAIEGTWARIFRSLDNYSASVTDASYRLKRYYKEYLYGYEQRNFFCKTIAEINMMSQNSRGSSKQKQHQQQSQHQQYHHQQQPQQQQQQQQQQQHAAGVTVAAVALSAKPSPSPSPSPSASPAPSPSASPAPSPIPYPSPSASPAQSPSMIPPPPPSSSPFPAPSPVPSASPKLAHSNHSVLDEAPVRASSASTLIASPMPISILNRQPIAALIQSKTPSETQSPPKRPSPSPILSSSSSSPPAAPAGAEAGPSASSRTFEFPSVCSKCNQSGELIKCSKCRLAFHLRSCSNPQQSRLDAFIETKQSPKWICSTCKPRHHNQQQAAQSQRGIQSPHLAAAAASSDKTAVAAAVVAPPLVKEVSCALLTDTQPRPNKVLGPKSTSIATSAAVIARTLAASPALVANPSSRQDAAATTTRSHASKPAVIYQSTAPPSTTIFTINVQPAEKPSRFQGEEIVLAYDPTTGDSLSSPQDSPQSSPPASPPTSPRGRPFSPNAEESAASNIHRHTQMVQPIV